MAQPVAQMGSVVHSAFDRLYEVGNVGAGAHVLQGENLFDITIVQAPHVRAIPALKIDDVGVRHFADGWVELDVRLRNAGSATTNLTHLDVHVLERHDAFAIVPPSATYELMLHPSLPHNLIRIAHALKPGDVDRVLVRVGNKFGPQLIEAEILIHYNGALSAASNPLIFETNPPDHIVFGAGHQEKVRQSFRGLFRRKPQFSQADMTAWSSRLAEERSRLAAEGQRALEGGIADYTRDQLAFLGVQPTQYAAIADRWRRRQEKYERAKAADQLPLAELQIHGVWPAQFGPVS